MSPRRNAWRKPCVANMAPSISAFGVGYDPMRRDRGATHDESVRMDLGCPGSEFGGVMIGRPGETMCRLTHREADRVEDEWIDGGGMNASWRPDWNVDSSRSR